MTHHVSTTQHYNQHIVFTNYVVWAQLTRGIKEWLTHIFVNKYSVQWMMSVMIVVLNVLKKSPWAFLLMSFYSLKTLVKMPKRSPFEEYLWCLSAISWWLPIGEDVFLTLCPHQESWENTFIPTSTVDAEHSETQNEYCSSFNSSILVCVCRFLPWFLFCCSNCRRKRIQAWLTLCWTAFQTSGLTRYWAPLSSTVLL